MDLYVYYPKCDVIDSDINFEPKNGLFEYIEYLSNHKNTSYKNTYGFNKFGSKNLIYHNHFPNNHGIFMKSNNNTNKSKKMYFKLYKNCAFPSNSKTIKYKNNNNHSIENIVTQSNHYFAYDSCDNILTESIDTWDLIEKDGCDVFFKADNNYLRIKILCNWTSSNGVREEWNNMTKNNNYEWNNIKIVKEDEECDFYVIINKTESKDYDPLRTIIFQMEPWCADPFMNWGVKTWGPWAKPDPTLFFQVRSHENYINNCLSQLNTNFYPLKNDVVDKTKGNLISSICSSKYFDPGHKQRIDFLKFIESKNDSDVQLNIWNQDNNHHFKSYMGPHPKNFKDAGIVEYKYYFMVENNFEKNFITEKIWESLITDTLVFYAGCPNIKEYIDERAFIELDMLDFEKSFNIIKNAIINNEYEKRLPFIRAEKEKVFNYYNFYATLERILIHEYDFVGNETNNELLYKKYFKNTHITNRVINPKKVMFLEIDSNDNNNNNKATLIDTLDKMHNNVDYIFIVNYNQKLQCDFIDTVKYKNIHVINYNYEYDEIGLMFLMQLYAIFNENVEMIFLKCDDKNKLINDELIKYINNNNNNNNNNNDIDFNCVGFGIGFNNMLCYEYDSFISHSKYIQSLDNPIKNLSKFWLLSKNSGNYIDLK